MIIKVRTTRLRWISTGVLIGACLTTIGLLFFNYLFFHFEFQAEVLFATTGVLISLLGYVLDLRYKAFQRFIIQGLTSLDDHEYDILETINKRAKATFQEIVKDLGIEAALVNKYLTRLEERGLLQFKMDIREMKYQLKPVTMSILNLRPLRERDTSH